MYQPKYLCPDCGWEGDDPICPSCLTAAEKIDVVDNPDEETMYPKELLAEDEDEDLAKVEDLVSDE